MRYSPGNALHRRPQWPRRRGGVGRRLPVLLFSGFVVAGLTAFSASWAPVTTPAGTTRVSLTLPPPIQQAGPANTQQDSALAGTVNQHFRNEPALPPRRDTGRDKQGDDLTPAAKPASAFFEPGPTATSPDADTNATEPPENKLTVLIKSGDSLFSLFKANGLSLQDLDRLTRSGKTAAALKRVHPGQRLDIYHQSGAINKLVYHRSPAEAVHFHRQDKGFATEVVEASLQTRTTLATGIIEDSLFLSGQRAGLSDKLIMSMVEIFGWDIDFALDIRQGDFFAVIFEEHYDQGEKVADGPILAAKFINRGRQLEALRYVDDKGRGEYFSPRGDSMRKAFLRTPVNYARISSRFNLRRRHPILHKIRAHRGVDYAAARGTPVRASGDGRVIYRGRKGGYGKTIVLRHGGTYTTLYAHLHRYARGMKVGKTVRQGQIIGQVGSTGLATGPHLHYEFRVRGVHRDPLKVKLPKAAPIAKRHKKDFLQKTRTLAARLASLSQTRLASNKIP